LLAEVKAIPDLTLVEFCHGLSQRGLKTVPSTVWRFFDRHGLTYKKRRLTRANKNAPT
jgi:transposase